MRTLFSALHHFPAHLAQAILRDAAQKRVPIGVFEATERSVAEVVAMTFAPLSALLSTPFIRPLRAARFLWTYLVPIVPAMALWDGLVRGLTAVVAITANTERCASGNFQRIKREKLMRARLF